MADAFTFGDDAVGSDLVFLDELILHRFGAGGGEFLVEFEVAVLR